MTEEAGIGDSYRGGGVIDGKSGNSGRGGAGEVVTGRDTQGGGSGATGVTNIGGGDGDTQLTEAEGWPCTRSAPMGSTRTDVKVPGGGAREGARDNPSPAQLFTNEFPDQAASLPMAARPGYPA